MPTHQDFEIAYIRLMEGLGNPVALTNRFLQIQASWDRAGRPAEMEFYIADWCTQKWCGQWTIWDGESAT